MSTVRVQAREVTDAGHEKVIERTGVVGLLERETYEGNANRVWLIACPACGYRFDGPREQRSRHIAEHDPEDFGLAPIGARRAP